jgi:hypothetical protein
MKLISIAYVWSLHFSLVCLLVAKLGDVIYTVDVENVKHILSNVDTYQLPPLRRLLLADVFGEGIFMVNGESWKMQRNRVFLLL